jgi:hypothetical protein
LFIGIDAAGGAEDFFAATAMTAGFALGATISFDLRGGVSLQASY